MERENFVNPTPEITENLEGDKQSIIHHISNGLRKSLRSALEHFNKKPISTIKNISALVLAGILSTVVIDKLDAGEKQFQPGCFEGICAGKTTLQEFQNIFSIKEYDCRSNCEENEYECMAYSELCRRRIHKGYRIIGKKGQFKYNLESDSSSACHFFRDRLLSAYIYFERPASVTTAEWRELLLQKSKKHPQFYIERSQFGVGSSKYTRTGFSVVGSLNFWAVNIHNSSIDAAFQNEMNKIIQRMRKERKRELRKLNRELLPE